MPNLQQQICTERFAIAVRQSSDLSSLSKQISNILVQKRRRLKNM